MSNHNELCEGCGNELSNDHIVRCGLAICKKCADYDDQESENEKWEAECIDCLAEILFDPTRANDKQRCDHCEELNGIGWA